MLEESDGFSEAGEEPERINYLREFAIERIDEVMKRAFRIVRHSKNKNLILDCMCLSFGWHDEIGGVTNSADLARANHCTKANVNKFVIQFQDVLTTGMTRMEAMPGQRDIGARAKFTKIRKNQCHE